MATKAERNHMGCVASLGCVLCRHLRLADDTPALVHHLRTGQGRMRAAHTDTLPLCFEHHVGATGVHSMGRQQFADMHGISEVELLAMTNNLLGITT